MTSLLSNWLQISAANGRIFATKLSSRPERSVVERSVPAPDFSLEAGFQTRENAPVYKLRALAIVAGRPIPSPKPLRECRPAYPPLQKR
jgi:hypothetical protein